MLAGVSVVVLCATALLGAVRSAPADVPAPAAAESPFLPATTAVGAVTGAPWDRPSDPTERAAAAGLRMLGTEGTALHLHAHLTITIDGQDEVVPAEIGIDNPSGSVSPLHTHDTTGIIHVESPVQADFTLGQFFTEWNVALDDTSIGAYPSSAGETFSVFVNQQPYSGNPAAIVFTNKMDIDIVVSPAGTAASPSQPFDWPEQY
ncbi:hypothetical protein B7R54_06760 [Subtercola boreus]|uniref:Uncharacterized protein n=1 Tax=Subtercola boreus TaxID=120213 RepID=A0A3E0VHK5_9MICO|nr:hypothetical protein B7R54_06760 [Subtercola boreus]